MFDWNDNRGLRAVLGGQPRRSSDTLGVAVGRCAVRQIHLAQIRSLSCFVWSRSTEVGVGAPASLSEASPRASQLDVLRPETYILLLVKLFCL